MRAAAVSVLSGLASLTLAGCADDPYRASLSQAAIFRAEADRPLTPLSYPVQAVHFTNRPEWAAAKVGKSTKTEWDVWITVESEMKRLCGSLPKTGLDAGLRQLLGLKPSPEGTSAGKFVRIKVDATQSSGPAGIGVFRPCADPDPTAPRCGNAIKSSDAYARWFAQNLLDSYRTDADLKNTGFPWTRMGYTYNWTPGANTIVGPQEYVIPKDTVVTIGETVGAHEFCSGT